MAKKSRMPQSATNRSLLSPVLVLLCGLFLISAVMGQNCKVEGCAQCRSGFSDRCDKCQSGYDDRFTNTGGVVIKTCLKVTSTGTILAIVLPICGCVLLIALIALFWWIHIKRLIAKNIQLYNQRLDDLVKKREEYERRRREMEPEYIAYMKSQAEYEQEMKKLKEIRDKIDAMEQQEYENRMRALQPPPPPPNFNIFQEMERDFLQRQELMQRSTSLKLPPNFVQQNPIPPPIIPLTINMGPQTYNPAGFAPTGGPQIYPAPTPYQPVYRGP